MARKKLKTSAIEDILSKAVFSKWCIVNTDNEFNYINNFNYKIDNSVKQYTVLNKPTKLKDGKMNQWTNQALMSSVLVVDTVDEIRFFDENLTEINHEKVSIKS